MKKILLFLFLAMPLLGFAQKSYVLICVSSGLDDWESSEFGGASMTLSGDIPSGIKNVYTYSERISSGKIMCLLGDKGYELEKAFMNTPDAIIIMSKNVSSSSSNIQSIKIEDEGEPYEVARYNLQGIPVKSYEKGVQVIVYSNYTTKTVVVE